MVDIIKPNKLSVAVARAGKTGFEVDTSHDQELFSAQNYNWDDLTALKNELGQGVLEFTGQVTQLVQNKEITNNLGSDTAHFAATVDLFFKEVTEFSDRIRVNREQHENKSGPLASMDEFNTYNRIAMTYHTLCNELTILITPIVSELMIITAKVVDRAKKTAEPVETKQGE